jgi:hypothetical protein
MVNGGGIGERQAIELVVNRRVERGRGTGHFADRQINNTDRNNQRD